MKTLIIHPHDWTTTFLKPIYRNIPDKTILTGGTFLEDVRNLIDSHERVMINDAFSGIVSRYVNEPADVLYNKVLKEYGALAERSTVALYNCQRLYLN
jgi:hypothetical protein